MNVDQKTQVSKIKKNKQTISTEPVSELSDSLHEIRTLSSQFVTQGKKPILLDVITSTTHLNPAFKSN